MLKMTGVGLAFDRMVTWSRRLMPNITRRHAVKLESFELVPRTVIQLDSG